MNLGAPRSRFGALGSEPWTPKRTIDRPLDAVQSKVHRTESLGLGILERRASWGTSTWAEGPAGARRNWFTCHLLRRPLFSPDVAVPWRWNGEECKDAVVYLSLSLSWEESDNKRLDFFVIRARFSSTTQNSIKYENNPLSDIIRKNLNRGVASLI